MSEEEIVNQMQEFVDWIKANKDKVNKQEELLAILQGMLDLYNQEKEKVQEYEKQLDLDYVDKNYVKRELYEQEKEKNNELIKIIKNVRQMHDTKCKIIDMMAEDIYKTPDDWVCKAMKMKEDCYADTAEDDSACKECIKEYYFKKARGEE